VSAFGEDVGGIEAEVILVRVYESGEVEFILRVVWFGEWSFLRVLLLAVMVALLRHLLFLRFGLSLGQVLGIAEHLGVHFNSIITQLLHNSTYHLFFHSYFSIIFTGGRPCHSLPRLVLPAYSTNIYSFVALEWAVFV